MLPTKARLFRQGETIRLGFSFDDLLARPSWPRDSARSAA
jgi:hypothetical protein